MILTDDVALQEALSRAGLPSALTEGPIEAGPDATLVVARQWRGLAKKLGSVPLIAVTDEVEQALGDGVADVLTEPLSDTMIRHRTRLVLAAARSADSTSEPGGAKDLLPRLLDACPDPVMAVDLEGRVLVFSAAAERLLGYTQQEVVDLHVGELYAQAGDASRIMKAMVEDADGRVMGLRVRLRTHQGEPVAVRLSASLVHDYLGRTVASVGIFRDDRVHRSLSQRLANATQQLIASEKRAAAVAVAGATAHELNQPLTAAMGLLELQMLDGAPEGNRLRRAYQQLHRMKDIVSRLSGVSEYRTTPYMDGEEILDL